MRHTVYRSEQPAHQDEDNHKEEHYEHGLLHGSGVIGDNQTETGYY